MAKANPPAETADDLFAEMLANATKHSGKEGVYVAQDREQFVSGVPIPAFALPLQFVIQNDVWPLHRMSLLAGPFGSCKSTLAFELSRWFVYAAGLANYIETENKIDSVHLSAMLGECMNRVIVHEAGTVEEWQSHLTNGIQFLLDRVKAKKTNNRPVLYIVDSMTGADTAEGVKFIAEHGHARGRAFSDMSIVLAQYFRTMSPQLKSVPISVLLINHQKRDLKTLPGGRMVEGKRKPGGDSQGFHATIDISVAKLGAIDQVKRRGLKVGMKCEKNSMGETGLTGYFEVLFSEKAQEGGSPIKRTWIDWYSSIPHFLTNCIKANRQKSLSDVITISESSNKWSSSTLGLSRVSASELGQAIVADTKLFTAIQDSLGIVRRDNKLLGPGAAAIPEPGPGFEPDDVSSTSVEIVDNDTDDDSAEEEV